MATLIRSSLGRPVFCITSTTPSCRAAFHTTVPSQATPFLLLSARSHALETQHFSKVSRLGVTSHVPNLEMIKSSEVDPFASRKTTSAVEGVKAETAATRAGPQKRTKKQAGSALAADQTDGKASFVLVKDDPVALGNTATASSVSEAVVANGDQSSQRTLSDSDLDALAKRLSEVYNISLRDNAGMKGKEEESQAWRGEFSILTKMLGYFAAFAIGSMSVDFYHYRKDALNLAKGSEVQLSPVTFSEAAAAVRPIEASRPLQEAVVKREGVSAWLHGLMWAK